MDSGGGRHERRQPRFVYLTDRPEGSTSGRFGWQLTAANHRPLGRGAALAQDLDSCRTAARDLRAQAADGDAVVLPHDGRWRWEVTAGRNAARSTHHYARRVECERALAQFLSALAAAEPDRGVVRHYGSRALRAFDDAARTGTPAPAGRS